MELTAAQQEVLDSKVTVPEHVVYRQFTEETIALNLETGCYHGLNGVAGKMIAALGDGAAPREVAELIASEYDVSLTQVQRDVAELCADLGERGLVELHGGEGG